MIWEQEQPQTSRFVRLNEKRERKIPLISYQKWRSFMLLILSFWLIIVTKRSDPFLACEFKSKRNQNSKTPEGRTLTSKLHLSTALNLMTDISSLERSQISVEMDWSINSKCFIAWVLLSIKNTSGFINRHTIY